MPETFTAPGTQPPGTFKRINFPQLALMDSPTGDGRLLVGAGRKMRDLPRTIYGQFANDPAHMGAPVVGTLTEVTFNEDGVISGSGWLLDDENGHTAYRYIRAGALRHNSVDLADVKVELEWESDDPNDPGFWEYTINFTEWAIGATTLVGVPAFKDARASIEDDDELIASVYAESVYTFEVPEEELVASATDLAAWEDFHMPEAETLTKIHADLDGVVTGHVGSWESCHDGIVGRCVRIPAPTDNYASFNKPGVPTDRGIVQTGPLVLGGHVSKFDLGAAANDPKRVWADVRVIPGRLGPWVSGRVRPGASQEMIHEGSASRHSGHWIDGKLRGIFAVNVEGFEVPGHAVTAFSLDDGRVTELVAGLDCEAPAAETVTEETTETTIEVSADIEDEALLAVLAEALRLEIEIEEEEEATSA